MPICIAGMHRSGTSMVAQLLHDAGVYLGPDSDLSPPGPANPEGYWENRRFVRLNERLLNLLGGGWDCPPAIPTSWTMGRLAPLRTEAEALLEEFADRAPWGWKDPRNCLTLPFWQAILGPLPVVIVVRNPLEVAQSLRKRNGFSYALGLTLWHISNQRLLDAVAPSERLVTHYGRYFEDPERELRRLLAFLDLPVAEEAIDQARAARVAELRHHRLTIQDLREAEAAPAIVDLYRELCAEAGWPEADSERPAAGGTAAAPSEDAALHPWDESTAIEFAGRPHRRPIGKGGRQLRQHLEAATRRIAELEETVRVQQLALAQHEAGEREPLASRQSVADQVDGRGAAGAPDKTLVSHDQE